MRTKKANKNKDKVELMSLDSSTSNLVESSYTVILTSPKAKRRK